MKTSVIEVHDMLSVLAVDEVEKRIGEVPGVESATVNYASGKATVRYDETRLEVADIKVIVHQRGHQPAGEPLPIEESEREPARKPVAEPTPTVAPASASKPEAAMPKTSTVAAVAVPAMTGPGENGQQDKTAPSAQPSTLEPAAPKAAPAAMAAPINRAGDGPQGKATPSAPPSATVAAPPKPSPVAKPSTPPAAAPKAAPDAISPTPTAAEPKPHAWKIHALSLTMTLSAAYTLCAIFDVLFPRFGLLAALAPDSPLPISGSPVAYLTGFALFTSAGFVLGALHGIAWEFWSRRLR